MSSTMSAMGGMPMPGGWTMSMMWLRLPGQSWSGAAVSFVAMWSVMMAAMMLPSLAPMLARYRSSLAPSTAPKSVALVAIVALSYCAVWAALGVAIYPFGAALASLTIALPVVARGVPIAAGLVVLGAGVLQFTSWKKSQLECWGESPTCTGTRASDVAGAWSYGVRLGVDCVRCGAGLTASLIVLGAMEPRVMAAVTLAMTIERVGPNGYRVARAVGVAGVVVGAAMIARALS